MQSRLAAIRRYHDMSQKEIAELIGVDVRTYINKEQGKTQFKANEMFIIAKYFGKTIEEIFLPENFEKLEVKEGVS